MESLRYDVEPYDIHTTVVEPGYFRTELLVEGSTIWPELSIDDYAPRTAPRIFGMKSMNGKQPGTPPSSPAPCSPSPTRTSPCSASSPARTPSRPPGPRRRNSPPEASRELGGALAYDDAHA